MFNIGKGKKMIDKELLGKVLHYLQENGDYEQDDFIVYKFIQNDSEITIYFDKDLISSSKWNIYELGIAYKEYIEYYAKSLHLSAVWIDLNDLSKDEAYYFKHCYEVYEQLAQYDLIMESEEL